MSLVDPAGRPVGSSAQAVLTIVLEGRTLDFGANTPIINKLPRESRIKIAEVVLKLLFPEIAHKDLHWMPRDFAGFERP